MDNVENYVYTSAWWIYKKPQQTINLILLLWQTRKILFYWMPNYGMLEEEIFIFCRMHAYFPIKFVNGLLSPSLSAHRVLSPYSVLSNKPLSLLSLIYVENPYIYIYIYYFLDCCKVRTSERELFQWAGDCLRWCGMDTSSYIHTYIDIYIWNHCKLGLHHCLVLGMIWKRNPGLW